MRAAETEYRDFLFSEAGVDRYMTGLVECRSAVARVLGIGSPAGISLMNNATTAIQLVLTALGATLKPGDSIITSDQEHPCVVRPLNMLAKRGARVVAIAAESEEEFLTRFNATLRQQHPSFVILSQVSYKNGRILPIGRIGEILARTDIPYIVDGSQAFGHIPIDVPATHAWVYIFSGHKWLGGPWGTGGLWNSERFAALNAITLSNWQGAGESASRGQNEEQCDPASGGRYEGGTMSYASFIGLDAACREYEAREQERFETLAAHRNAIIARLDHSYCLADSSWDGPHAPGILALPMPPHLHSWTFAEFMLEKYGVAVKPFRPPETPDAIRVSCSPATTPEEIDLLIQALNTEAKRLG